MYIFSNSDLQQDAKKIFQLTHAERKYDVNARRQCVSYDPLLCCFWLYETE